MVQDEDSGEMTASWEEQATVWAERRDLKGSERFEAQQTAAKVEAEYRIRYPTAYMPTPSDTWRVVDLGTDREFDIVAVLEIGRREGLSLLVSGRAEAVT
jgi:SPP1 family predicted phage head-tail adaptor